MALNLNKIESTTSQLLTRGQHMFAAALNKSEAHLSQVLGEALEGPVQAPGDRDLAPDTHLAEWVREKAARTELVTTDQHDDPTLLAEQVIPATTFQKSIDRYSLFGVAGVPIDPRRRSSKVNQQDLS